MKISQKIAEIRLDTESRRILRITLYERKLRFKCQRCAVFCCKLGGPKLSEKDTQRLKQLGKDTEFLDTHGCLRSKEDGSCTFLQFDAGNKVYECSVYDFRPTLCRLYPFYAERSSSSSYTLKLIPCCNGLNSEDAELVNANFVKNRLFNALLEL